MKNFVIVLFIAFGAFLTFFCGCHPKPTTTVQDSLGVRVILKKPAYRIVSTVPSNTEILYALGLKERVVGLTRYCGKTCNINGKVIIGGWVDPDYKKIRALKPDLIFAFGGLQRKHLDKFREIAPTYCFEPATVAETLQVILDIGQLTGRQQKAEEIVKKQRELLARIQAKLLSIPSQKRLRVARVFGTDTDVITVGRKSFLTDVIKLAGGVNVFSDVDDDYFHVQFERLASLDPDVLIVHGEKTETEQKRAAFKESPQFNKLKAVKNGRVLVYSCDYLCHPNAAIADTVEMVARGLYPDLFSEELKKNTIPR
jgi:iron complex transport system substrate-binding protein